MFQSGLRLTTGSLLVGMLVSRAALATDIASPATVISDLSPHIELKQEGVVAPAYRWRIDGSHFSFTVQDAITQAYSFVIDAGADGNLLCLSGSNVGIGHGNPQAKLHLLSAAQVSAAEILSRFEISDDSIGKLEIRNGSATDGIFHPRLRGTTAAQAVPLTFEGLITTDSGLNPVVAYDAARRSGGAVVTRPLVIYRNNGVAKVIIGPNGVVTANSFNPVSSRALKHDIESLDSQEAANALRQLAPVKFVYNDDESNQKRVGFIAEDVPEVVAASDRQSVPIMDVLALVTRVVKDQQQTIEQQKLSIAEQKKGLDNQQRLHIQAIERLTRRLNALESRNSQ